MRYNGPGSQNRAKTIELGGIKAWLYLEVFGGAAAELVSRLGVVGAALFAR